jgi:exosortase A-associated hydrolase 2
VQAFFLEAPHGGRRLCLYHPPGRDGAARGIVVHAHALAEEMNKSRHMVARQARELSHCGFAVLLIDLSGCGDSSGDFADASWTDWVADLVTAAQWLSARHDAPLTWWGLRAGCLLCAQAAQSWPGPSSFLFWQPTPSGAAVLQQFLRLRSASALSGSEALAAGRGGLAALREQLNSGQPVDVAGYRLSPGLADGLERARLLPPVLAGGPGHPGSVVWLEVAAADRDSLLPASEPVIRQWKEAGFGVRAQATAGTPFWAAVEPMDSPALIETTSRLLQEALSP